jgi:hypothetical protein
MADKVQLEVLSKADLTRKSRGYSVQAVGCVVLGILVAFIAILSQGTGGQAAFGLVAVYFGFFALNRSLELGRLRRLIGLRDDNEAAASVVRNELEHPPVWRTVSEWVIGATAIVLIVGLNIFVGFVVEQPIWLRVLFGLNIVLVLVVALRAMRARLHRGDLKFEVRARNG